GKSIPCLHVVKVLLHDDIAATCKGGVLAADDYGLTSDIPPRILSTIDEADDIAIVEIPEAVNLIGNRNGIADAVHDLGRQFKTKVHAFGSNVEQDVAWGSDGVAVA